MKHTQHTPTLHIFVGEHNHYFTLRESYLHTIYINRVPIYQVRYSHLKNLSQNWNEAVEKAKEASKAMGIPLVVRDSEVEQLREIERRTAEEIEQEKKLLEEKWRLAEEEAQQRRLMHWNLWVEKVTLMLEGKDPDYMMTPYMPIGAHKDRPLSKIPLSYFQWLIYKSGILEGVEDVTFNKMAFVTKWIQENMEIPEPAESKFVGEIGQKMTRELTVDSVRSFDGRFGITYIYKLLDEQGNNFVWFTSKPALKDRTGKMLMKFDIKDHNEYKGTKQTIITRAKVI